MNNLLAAQAAIQLRPLEPLKVVRPTPDLAKRTNLDESADDARLYLLCLVNGMPYRIIETYESTSMDELVAQYDDSFTQRLEKLLSLVHPDALERVQCRMPQEQEATFLNMSRNHRFLRSNAGCFSLRVFSSNTPM